MMKTYFNTFPRIIIRTTIRFGFSAISGVIISILHDGTRLPMSMVISGCGILSFLFSIILY